MIFRTSGFAILLGAFCIHLALRTIEFFPVDDAYISFRYAANLAQGEGLVFNPGERVEGYSNFFFILLLAASAKLGVTPPLAARLINMVSVAFILAILSFGLFATSRAGRGARLTRRRASPGSNAGPSTPWMASAALGWLAGVILILSPHTALNVLSGLEAPLTAALLTAGVFFLGRDRPVLAALSFLLVAMSRPEGIVLAFGAAVWDLWGHRSEIWARGRIWLGALAFPYGLFFAWRLVYYGSLLPNSVRAKTGFSADSSLKQSLTYMERGGEAYWPLILLSLAGLLLGREGWPRLWSAAGWIVLGVTGLCLLTGSGDPYRHLIRYLYPGIPLLVMAGTLSAGFWMQRARTAGRRSWQTWACAGALLLFAFQVGLTAKSSFDLLVKENRALRANLVKKTNNGLAEIFAQDREPHTSEWLKTPLGQHDLARWLLKRPTPGATLVSSQVGIAPYYSGLRVLDTFGLVTSHIARLPGAPGIKKDADFIFSHEPDYFAFKKRPNLKGGIPADAELFRDPRLRRWYDLGQVFDLGGARLLLFQRRPEPVEDIRYDFVAQFSRRRIVRQDGKAWAETGPSDRKRVVRHFQGGFIDKYRSKKLRRILEPVLSGTEADFAGADSMRDWLAQWRSWIEHRPGFKSTATAIRYRVRIPEEAVLSFGLGAPVREKQLQSNGNRAGAVRYSIFLEDGGQSRQLFTSMHDPRGNKGHRQLRQFEVDLRPYAGREVTLYFKARRLDKVPERGGWVEPRLVRRGQVTTSLEQGERSEA